MSLLMKPASPPRWGMPHTGTHITAGLAEEVIVETDLHYPFRFWMYLFLSNMIDGDAFTVRVYVGDNAGADRLKDEQGFVDAQEIKAYEVNGIYGDEACRVKVTLQRTAGADRAFDYRWNVES